MMSTRAISSIYFEFLLSEHCFIIPLFFFNQECAQTCPESNNAGEKSIVSKVLVVNLFFEMQSFSSFDYGTSTTREEILLSLSLSPHVLFLFC